MKKSFNSTTSTSEGKSSSLPTSSSNSLFYQTVLESPCNQVFDQLVCAKLAFISCPSVPEQIVNGQLERPRAGLKTSFPPYQVCSSNLLIIFHLFFISLQ